MKKIKILLLLILPAFLLITGCIDWDILEYKEGVSLPPVTDLTSSIENGNEVTVQWTIPTNIPAEFERPLSVYIQVYRGITLEAQTPLENEPTSYKYTIPEPDKEYRIVVKMLGLLKESEYGKSSQVYSLGKTVTVH